jgi:hypothetical protein
MRWEGGRAWGSSRLIEWERAAIEKLAGRMEDVGMWRREGGRERGREGEMEVTGW